MLKYLPFTAPRKLDSSQMRVLRSATDSILVGFFRKNETEIQSINVSDNSKTVVIFKVNMNMDLINASFSREEGLLHLTERIKTKSDAIAFRSKIFDLHKNSVSCEKLYKCPIDGQFVEIGTGGINFLYYSSETLIFAKIQRSNHVITVSNVKTINNVIWFSVLTNTTTTTSSNNSSTASSSNMEIMGQNFQNGGSVFCRLKRLIVIHGTRNSFSINEFRDSVESLESAASMKILLHPQAKLPDQLSLIPTCDLTRLPLFNTSNYRIYAFKSDQKYYIVNQIYAGSSSNCSFQFSIYPSFFNQTISIPNVAADIPICAFKKESLIFVYAPNNFITILDITHHIPVISTLSKHFIMSICGECAAPLCGDFESIIDLDNTEIYNVELNFNCPQLYLKSINSKSLYAFATICVRLPNIEYLTSILHIIELTNNHSNAIQFFEYFFSLCQDQRPNAGPSRSHSSALSQLTDSQSIYNSNNRSFMLPFNSSSSRIPKLPKKVPTAVRELLKVCEDDYPSASTVSRTHWFFTKLKETKTSIDSCQMILSFMKQQNNVVSSIRSALDQWIAKHHPSQLWQLIIGFAIMNEAAFCHFPSVPQLGEEIEKLSQKFCSRQMIEISSKNGVIGRRLPKGRDDQVNQLEYWSKRLPQQVAKQDETDKYNNNGLDNAKQRNKDRDKKLPVVYTSATNWKGYRKVYPRAKSDSGNGTSIVTDLSYM